MASDPLIENLLVLQDRDVRLDDIRRSLEDIPLRTAALQRDIATAQSVYQGRLADQKAVELKRRELERKTLETEDQRVKLRTQQLSVKKNDEYAAMDRQIEATSALIDQLENETLDTMMKADELAPLVQKQKAATEADVATIKVKIDALARAREKLEADLAGAAALAEEARAKIPADLLASYAYVKTRIKHPPYIVPLEEMRCMGCHLKVSNDVQTQARIQGTITRCDGCGRIVYLER